MEEVLVPEEEQPYEVPTNWRWIKLKGINKDKKRTVVPSKFNEETFELYSVPSYPEKSPEIIKGKEIGSSKQLVNNNDVLLCKINPRINRVWKVCNEKRKFRQLASTEWIVISENIVIYPNYLLYLLKSPYFRKLLTSNVSGVGGSLTRARPKEVENYPVIIPPLNEQKRIADKVERLLSKIEKAKQLIEEAKETFELRRAAILDKAFRGELTRKWREENSSIESALERIELIKQERFYIAETKKEISEITEMFDELNTEECIDNNEWLYLKANMFCYNINCGGTPSKDISEEGEIPFLKVYNIVNNKVSFSYKPQYIPKEVHKSKLKKSILKANDVIMNIVGPPLKKIAIIPEEYYEMNMNQAIVRFRPIKYVLPKYLYYCLQYDETLRDVINETRGVVGQSNISVSQSRNLIMPIPPLEEQAEIVYKLEEMIKREEIALSLVSDEKNLDELKQSILSKAFRGELGTNDPCEESAIELLKEVLQEQVK
nr:restriction endonuclease subunit S [Bacillus velezensis]